MFVHYDLIKYLFVAHMRSMMQNRRTNAPKVDIVILNCNSGKSLQETVLSLKENTDYENYRIIVVDNGSVDNSTAFIKNHRDILLVENHQNLGCPGGLNQAIPHLKDKYTAFLNDDLIFKDPSWLSVLVSEMEKNKTIGATGFKLYKYYTPDIAEMHSTYLDRFSAYAGYVSSPNPKIPQGPHEVPYIGLGAILVRTELFLKVKFQERYFLYCDDVDFGLKLWFMDYRLKLIPEAWALHKHQTAVKRNLTELRMWYLVERNSLLTFLIFTDNRETLRYLPTVLAYRAISITWMLSKRQKTHAFGGILAMLGLVFHWRWIKSQKQALKTLRKGDMTYTDVAKKSLYDQIVEESRVFKIIKRASRRLKILHVE